MALSDHLEDFDPNVEIGDLIVSLNGLELSGVAEYEAEDYGLPRGGPVEMGMVTVRFPLGTQGNTLEVDMRAEQAEEIAYDLLAKAEDAQELVDYE